jgi:hypothetical protein
MLKISKLSKIDKQKLTSANVSNLEKYARELHKIY